MIYNLLQYLIINLATIAFVSNGFQQDTIDNAVNVSEGGGIPDPQIDRKDFVIQVMSRAKDKPKARKLSYDVYNLINKKFGLTLPSDTVDGESFPAVKTWKITAVALPGFIGNDENGRPLFSTNYTVTTE